MWQQERLDGMDTDPSNPLPYLQASALAHVVVEALVSGNRSCLPALFNRFEDLLTTGPEEDLNLLVVGFIEDLQGALGWAKFDPTPIYAYLGPTSRLKWDDLLRSWEALRKRQASEPRRDLDAMPHVTDPKLRRIVQDIYRPPLRGPAWRPKGPPDHPRLRFGIAERAIAWATRLVTRLRNS
jgi:hypothetical protein